MLSFQDAINRASDLPVFRLLPDFLRSCNSGSVSIISASAGSGKTTLIPLACAELLEPGQRVLVCSPRRVSARSCARRLSQLLDDRVGHLVGFSVRGQSERSTSTRIEFVTPGVLTRMIHSDPELQGIGCVILDEFHERAVDCDLACAFLSDIREVLREDLRLVIMSATVDIDALRSLLADFSPRVFELDQELYPVDIVWEAPPRGVDFSKARGSVFLSSVISLHLLRGHWNVIPVTHLCLFQVFGKSPRYANSLKEWMHRSLHFTASCLLRSRMKFLLLRLHDESLFLPLLQKVHSRSLGSRSSLIQH